LLLLLLLLLLFYLSLLLLLFLLWLLKLPLICSHGYLCQHCKARVACKPKAIRIPQESQSPCCPATRPFAARRRVGTG